MVLKCHRLDLIIKPAGKPGPEGWIHLDVRVSVPGFEGGFGAELQVEDLERFRNDLIHMDKHLGKDCKADLSGVEPGISISLESDKLGNIEGEYRFESDMYNGKPTCLSGAFNLDQTFLNPLIKSISEDLKMSAVSG